MYNNMQFNILIFGVGGTGGNLATRLCQFLAGVDNEKFVLTLVDGDTVSVSNLKRQPYQAEDVGMNKAECLAGVLTDAYGINVRYWPRYIDEVSDIDKIVESSKVLYKKHDRYGCGSGKQQVVVLCGCVDNTHARKLMHEYFEANNTVIYIDSGNEFQAGEVVYGLKKDGKILSPDKIYWFPTLFDDDQDMTPRSEESCEALNNSAPQHILVNVLAATAVMSGLCQLLTEGKCPTGICRFDALRLFMRQDEYVPPREELRIAVLNEGGGII